MAIFLLLALWALGLGAQLGLTDQEAYYWLWSRVPAGCYFEHPPFQAWVTAAFTGFFGNGAWAVRFPAILSCGLAFWFFRVWVRERYNERVSGLAASLVLASFFFPMALLIALPDSFLAPWAVLTFLFAERKRPVETGICLGLAALSKWTAAVLIPGVVVALLAGELMRARAWGRVLVAGALAILLQYPVLKWNADHGWASFLFHLEYRQPGAWPSWGQVAAHLAGFVGAQILLGGFGFAVTGLWLLRRRSGPSAVPREGRPSWMWWSLPAFLVFGYSSLRGETRFYWTGVAFFPLAAEWAARVSAESTDRLRARLRLFTWATPFLASLVFLLPVGAYLRPITEPFKVYDLRLSPRGDLEGWREWVRENIEPEGLVPPKARLIAGDFRLAAQAAWAAGLSDPYYVGTIGNPFQFQFWERAGSKERLPVVFFGDNRRSIDQKMAADLCAEPLAWKWRSYSQRGEVVKRIWWSVCSKPLF